MVFPTGWTRKAKITIPDAGISGSNSDFPILITEDNLPAEMLDGGANSALNGGGDVRFSEDSAGTIQLALDVIVFVTGGMPDVEIWAKLPTLNTGAAKDIYVWYKKTGEVQPDATAAFGRHAVWSSSEIAVLMEDAAPVDHTGNHTLSLAGSLTNISGPFGQANSFGGNDRLSNSDASLRDIPLSYDTTVSVISRRASYGNPFAVLSWEGGDDLVIYPMDSLGGDGGLVVWRDLGLIIINNNSEALANTWVHNSFTTRSGNNHELHTNGASAGTSTGTGSAGPFSGFYIGGFGATSQDFNGDIAQVVVWKTARTPDWIATEYANQNDPAAFASAGTPEAVGGGTTLTVNDGQHGLTSDDILLAQVHTLNSMEASHSITSGNVVSGLGVSVSIQDMGHTVSSDMVNLSQIQNLIVSRGRHSHAADSLIISQGQTLTNTNSQHNVGSDSLILSLAQALTIRDNIHAVTSDEVILAQLQALVIQNATHGLSSDVAGLFNPTAFSPNSGRTHKAERENRNFSPTRGDKTIQPTNNRTLRI
ncbi:MAG: hypothetical protein COB49_12835 [Alphaproteobacteria bacterium]|nr:MAG: hypothetical protein COB49_12835 [Alphaproteobacteria bacterium]